MDFTSGITFTNLSQMIFSVGVCWYLLVFVVRKLETLATNIMELNNQVKSYKEQNMDGAKETKEMFTEIKTLIKETSQLVNITSESVRVQNELMKSILARMDRGSHT